MGAATKFKPNAVIHAFIMSPWGWPHGKHGRYHRRKTITHMNIPDGMLCEIRGYGRHGKIRLPYTEQEYYTVRILVARNKYQFLGIEGQYVKEL